MKKHVFIYGVLLTLIIGLPTVGASAATIAPPKKPHAKTHRVTESPATQKKMARLKHSTRATAAGNRSTVVPAYTAAKRKKKYYERFYASSFANDQVEGDVTVGEDPIVRAAAIEALGDMNGTVVSIDPDSGRVLPIVQASD